MPTTNPPSSVLSSVYFDELLLYSDYPSISALQLPNSMPTSTPAVPVAPPGMHLFLARTFRTYYHDSDCNEDEIHGLFVTSRQAEIAMLRAFKKDLVDCCMRMENHLEERGADGSVAVHAGDGEGEILIGRVTPIMISPKTLGTLGTLAGVADGDDAPGQKRRRKEVATADEDELDEELQELEALRAIEGGTETSSESEGENDGGVEAF